MLFAIGNCKVFKNITFTEKRLRVTESFLKYLFKIILSPILMLYKIREMFESPINARIVPLPSIGYAKIAIDSRNANKISRNAIRQILIIFRN